MYAKEILSHFVRKDLMRAVLTLLQEICLLDHVYSKCFRTQSPPKTKTSRAPCKNSKHNQIKSVINLYGKLNGTINNGNPRLQNVNSPMSNSHNMVFEYKKCNQMTIVTSTVSPSIVVHRGLTAIYKFNAGFHPILACKLLNSACRKCY